MNKSDNRTNSAKETAKKALKALRAAAQTPYYLTKVYKVSRRNRDGYTVDNKMRPITSGYSIAVKETQDSHGLWGLMRTTFHSLRDGLNFGGWLDTATGRYYYDSVVIEQDEQTAIAKGLENEQIAIYNLTDGKEIRLTA